jgi:transcriptional regulator with XRE-family HTH domain
VIEYEMNKRKAKGPHPIDVAMGRVLRRARQSVGFSQTDLARASGVTFQQVQKYEKGTNRISVSRLVMLGNALGVEPPELVRQAMAEAE